ncbi:TetR/AcrR family transcriptional regulator [Nocardia gipuzkoensis]|uniref:TetR/AcrR family transcriptional regulator n=1 Tax=Nocardia gipuzkoensis TaxID=2749991 RepID=UPI003EE203F4
MRIVDGSGAFSLDLLNALKSALSEFGGGRAGCQAVVVGQRERVERRPRPGGRSARVVAAVRQATLDLLLRQGYDGFEIPDVARLAGVHPTTIRRRWPDKQDLVADAALTHMDEQIPIPDTGSLRADLIQLVNEVVAVLARPPLLALLRTQVALADSARIRVASRRFWTARFEGSAPIVERAIARGELPGDTDPLEFNEVAIAPVYLRILVTGEPVDDCFIHRCVERTLRAFASGPPNP